MSIGPASGSSLASRIAGADERALEESYRRYGPVVRSYLRRFVDRDEADEVLQTVFLELWRFRERIDPARPFEAWLFGIARKRAIDQLRRRRPRSIPVATLGDLIGDDGDLVAERMAGAAELRTGLARLPTEQQVTLELAYFGQLTQREIAARLGVPLGTVKARTARGLRRLGGILDGGDRRSGPPGGADPGGRR